MAFAGVLLLLGDLLLALFGVLAGVFDLAGDLLLARDLEFDLAGDGLLSAIFTDFGVFVVDLAGVRPGVRLRLVAFLAGVLVSSLPKLTSLIVCDGGGRLKIRKKVLEQCCSCCAFYCAEKEEKVSKLSFLHTSR